jgi:hypothetical protein
MSQIRRTHEIQVIFKKIDEGDHITDEELLTAYTVARTLEVFSSAALPIFGLARTVAIQYANTLQGYIRARGLKVPADPILP